MVAFYRHILGLLDIVHAFQYGESVADTCNAHRLEVVVQQSDQGLADDLVVCTQVMRWLDGAS